MELTHLLGFLGGSVVAPIAGYFKDRADNSHAEEMARIAKDAAKEAAQAGLQQAEETTRATEVEKRMDAFMAAIQAEKAITGTHAWVADVRALFRPALTVALIVLLCVHDDPAVKVMASAAVGFWFGAQAQPGAAAPATKWPVRQGDVWFGTPKPQGDAK